MNLEINPNQCRLCLHENSYPLIDLCSEKGNALGLRSILKKHFWFLIIDNDWPSIHRKICQTCWSKTLEFHSFYTNIESVQQRLYAGLAKSALDAYQYHDTIASYVINVETILEENHTESNINVTSFKSDEFSSTIDVYDDKTLWQSNDNDDNHSISCSDSDYRPLAGPKSMKKYRNRNAAAVSMKECKKEPIIDDYDDDDNDGEEDSLDDSEMEYKPRKKDNRKRTNRKSKYVRTSSRRSYSDKSIDEQMRDYFDMKCKICDLEMESFRMAKTHYRTDHQEKGYIVCCNRKYYRRFQAVDHVMQHINPDHVYKCDICKKECMDSYKLKSHMKTHIAQHLRPFKCTICGSGFMTEFQLEKHTYLKHEMTKDQESSGNVTIVKSEMVDGEPVELQMYNDDDGNGECDDDFDEKYDPDAADNLEPKKKKVKRNDKFTPTKRRFKPAYIKSSTKRDYTDSRIDAQMRQYFNMKCDICGVDMDTFRGAKGHYRKLHQQEGYITCCGKKFFRRFRAVDHTLRHVNPDNGYKCEPCGKEFMDRYTLKCHMETHTPNHLRPFHCNQCEGGFMTQYDLTRHIRVTHYTEEDKKIECKYCAKRFVSISIRDAHVRLVHEFVYAQICDICAKVFKTKQQLDHHTIAMHTDTPKVQCDICGIWLKNFLSLPKHMRRHKNCDPCECPVCHKIFRNKDVYNDHKRDAHTFKSVNCMLCEKVFKSAGRLREHMTSHTGQNLYTCQYCSRGFKRNSTLHTHRKKAHYDEWLRDRKPPRTVGTLGVASQSKESTVAAAVPTTTTTTLTTEPSPPINNTITSDDGSSVVIEIKQQILESMSPSTLSMHHHGSNDSSMQNQQQHEIHQQQQHQHHQQQNFSPMHHHHMQPDNNMSSPQQPLGLVIKEQIIEDITTMDVRQQNIETSTSHHTVSVIIKEQYMDNSQPMQISQDSQD